MYRSADNLIDARLRLLNELERQGIDNPDVLDAIASVPREEFVPPESRKLAYENRPLPIGKRQTISQPLVVALMTAALELNRSDRVLEIGTGSGYAAAILSCVAGEVDTIERHQILAELARERLKSLGYANVHVRHDNGCRGWPEHAPYDAIVATAAAREIPTALREQLKVGGRLVLPVELGFFDQQLQRIRKLGTDSFATEHLGGVRFVPLVDSLPGSAS